MLTALLSSLRGPQLASQVAESARASTPAAAEPSGRVVHFEERCWTESSADGTSVTRCDQRRRVLQAGCVGGAGRQGRGGGPLSSAEPDPRAPRARTTPRVELEVQEASSSRPAGRAADNPGAGAGARPPLPSRGAAGAGDASPRGAALPADAWGAQMLDELFVAAGELERTLGARGAGRRGACGRVGQAPPRAGAPGGCRAARGRGVRRLCRSRPGPRWSSAAGPAPRQTLPADRTPPPCLPSLAPGVLLASSPPRRDGGGGFGRLRPAASDVAGACERHGSSLSGGAGAQPPAQPAGPLQRWLGWGRRGAAPAPQQPQQPPPQPSLGAMAKAHGVDSQAVL
jgi:hypothetical protein